ncbi:MAG: thioredoxin-dependent thiol peroxidase [Calditrichia bacterium]
MLQTGDKAPDFNLPSDAGEQVSLADFRDKKEVVLYFYPKDNTSGCTTEACDFRDSIRDFDSRDAVILGVSPDSIQSHEKFKAKHDLNFTLLSDPDHKVAEAYGVWGEKKRYGRNYMGIFRTTFVIGKDGIIKHVFENVKPAGHSAQVLNIL